MNRDQARRIGKAILAAMPHDMAWRVKAMDVAPKLHQGMMTIRIYMKNVSAPEPEVYIFKEEEL